MTSEVGSLIYVKVMRRAMELLPRRLRTLWKNWELRAMVLLSLNLQIILIFFGNRRKRTARNWVRIVLWCTYLMADSVATVALGVILDNLGSLVDGVGGDGRLLDPDVELTAFWAPFLLLHLGGPDTITAYSMEDNEMWLRHLLGLGVETGVALYIFLLSWTSSRLSILSILMLCAGIIKYGERTWSLRSASIEEFRASMISQADPGPNYPKFMQEYALKQYEGFAVTVEKVDEVPATVDVSLHAHEEELLPTAYELLQAFKRLFVDLILGVDDRENSRSLFSKIRIHDAYKLIEMEIGFVYDMLYSKASLVHSKLGWTLRSISFSCTGAVLVLFSLDDHKHCSDVDLIITYMLLVAAILLEVYAVFLHLSSDWTDLWLNKHLNIGQKFISHLRPPKPLRWSKSVAQFNALSFYLKDKPMCGGKILKLLHLNEVLEKHHYTKYREVSYELRKLIFKHLKSKSEDASNVEITTTAHIRNFISYRGSRVLECFGLSELEWSVKGDFDQSILIWHIATYLCYREDCDLCQEKRCPKPSGAKLSKRLSQYMLYLLVMRPTMLPVGIGMIRFRDTEAEVKRFFKEYKSVENKSAEIKSVACKTLLKVDTEIEPEKVKGDKSRSVLFEGCRLASQLQHGPRRDEKEKKWEMISNVWVEMLAYAASRCRGNYHAQHLRRGGELLSHVWLMMAHFGLSEQFQESIGPARVKFV